MSEMLASSSTSTNPGMLVVTTLLLEPVLSRLEAKRGFSSLVL